MTETASEAKISPGAGAAGAAGVQRIVVVGAGPRAVMLLERLIAQWGEDNTARTITLVDPHEPGAGRIWRREQSSFLKLNSMAQDVTVFTDESCTIEGPIRPGPSLIEWVTAVRAGELSDVVIDDALVAAELAALRGSDFPTRRLQSYYLDWFWRSTVANAPAHTSISWRRDTVTTVHAQGDHQEVVLLGGDQLTADVVIYALGHNGSAPSGGTSALIAAAAQHGFTYVAPDFTADADLSGLAAEQDVIVRGLGLAAIDLIVLVTEGRGGRYVRDGDELRYVPSGLEPRLHLGSRRGVPYRSKVSSVVVGEPPRLEVITPEAIERLLQRPGLIDFDTDVWPLISHELLWGHYRELFTGHPERVLTTWEEFSAVLRRAGHDPDALRRAIEAAVPDPLDRFDVPRLDRPLAGERYDSFDEVQQRLRQHIADDLVLRTTPERSSSQALFLSILFSFMALADVPTERWSARSRAVSLPVTWHTFFSYVASGPPSHRLEELLALSRAGIVQFLGPDVSVSVDAQRGFVATSPAVPGEVVARTLVDAWLPPSAASSSTNIALRELARIHGHELHVADDSFAGSLGRIEVDEVGRVIGADGRPHERVFALGAFTSSTDAGAFTRPRSNSLSLRLTDRVAVAIARSLAGVPSA